MIDLKEIECDYGKFLSKSSNVKFDHQDVPDNVRPLIPHAHFWGVSDDHKRYTLAHKAPKKVKILLKKLIRKYDDELDEWLAGEQASRGEFSEAYIAFSAMRMAADYMQI